MPKGGDIVIFEDKKIIVSELKFRAKPFPNEANMKSYLQNLIHEYKKNMIIGLECNDTEAYENVLNYTKELKGRELPYGHPDLKRLEVIAELENAPLKPKFEQLVIKNARFYHEPPNNSDLLFKKSIEPSLNYFNIKGKNFMEEEYPKKFIDVLENPSYKINSSLEEDKPIFSKYFYEK